MNAHSRDFRPEAPNNVQAEQALLGAIFINNDAFQAVSAFLKPEHFYEPLHRRLYETISSMIEQGKQVTPVMIRPFIPVEEKVGGITLWEYVVELASGAVTIINARDYGLSIVNEAEFRKLVEIGEEILAEAFNHQPDRSAAFVASEGEAKLAELRVESPKEQGPGTAKAVAMRLKERALRNEKAPTIPLALEQIREVLGGDLEVGNLYGMLSSSGEGKTSLLMQIIHYAAVLGHPTLLLSYDQSPEQSIEQIVSQTTGIEGTRIRRQSLQEREWERYYTALTQIADLPIVVERCHRENITQIGSHARRFMKRYGKVGKPALIALDHVRKVTPRDPKAHEGRIASEINGSCKAYAGELGCVWLNLNQRNSFGMKRENPRPISADMFGGEQAKEDYDAILYLYRPDKYKEDQLRIAKDSKDKVRIEERFANWAGLAELGALKVRYGDPTQRRKIQFEPEFTRYVSLRDDGPPAFEGMGF